MAEIPENGRPPLDTLIVGGGPGGLTAALYLARFRRRVQVLDAGNGRCAWIPRSHNLPGWPDGLPGHELLTRLRNQAERYGAGFAHGSAETAMRDGATRGDDGLFTVTDSAGGRWRARTLIIATGVEDREPELPDLYDAVRRGLVRHCPVCDAWEARDNRIGVLGHGSHGALEALFLRDYAADVTLLTGGRDPDIPGEMADALARAGIRVETRAIRAVRVEGDRIAALALYEGEGEAERTRQDEEPDHLAFDTLYSALGSVPRNALARALGAELAADGRVVVADHGRTSIPGLYAIGDVTPGLNQIACAEADAARAAIHIHNCLRPHPGTVQTGSP